MLAALGLFALVEVVGLAAAPLTALLLGRLPGAGLGFSKLVGLLLVTWVVWMAASLGVAAYGVPLVIGVLVALAVAGMLSAGRLRELGQRLEQAGEGRRAARLARPAPPPEGTGRPPPVPGGAAGVPRRHRPRRVPPP